LDRILHFQQIVELPREKYFASNSIQSNTKANVPAQKPIRQQPKGLKMRFRPIGFGTGAVGDIGSSSESANEEDPTDLSEEERRKVSRKPIVINSNDMSSSESDVEMAEAPLPTLKPVVKTISNKLARADKLMESRIKKSKKRKHEDDGGKTKSSSFTSNIDSNSKGLKKRKKRKTDFDPPVRISNHN
jgi:hypothetical protein